MCLSTRVAPVGRWAKNVAASRGASRRAVDRALVIGVLAALGALDLAQMAHAQEPSPAPASARDEEVHHVEPPPPLSRHPALPMIDVHATAGIPLVTSGVCPPDADCVLGACFGFGAGTEIRDVLGVGFIASYDFWLIDSGTVFELGTLHALRGGVRYTIDDASRIHPFIEGSLLLVAFGDTSTIAAAGGGIVTEFTRRRKGSAHRAARRVMAQGTMSTLTVVPAFSASKALNCSAHASHSTPSW